MSPGPDPRDPGAESPGERGLVARPLAGLASLAGKLPSQAPPAAAARAEPPAEEARFAKALAGRLVIARESKGRGGKTVTIVRGVAGHPAVLEALARALRHELGTGVRAEAGELLVQGALTERVAASLARRGAARIVIGN